MSAFQDETTAFLRDRIPTAASRSGYDRYRTPCPGHHVMGIIPSMAIHTLSGCVGKFRRDRWQASQGAIE